MCGCVRRVAGQPQRDLGLDRGGQVARAAVEVAQVPSARCWDRIQRAAAAVSARRRDPEEVAQQQVLGVHRHVGLELALPPALRRPGGRAGGREPGREGVRGRAGAGRRRRCRLPADRSSTQASRSARWRPSATSSARARVVAGVGRWAGGRPARPGRPPRRRADDGPRARPRPGRRPPRRGARRGAAVASSSARPRGGRASAGQLPPGVAAVHERGHVTGSDFLRARRSARTGLPVTAGSPQMPSRSSTSWNASPSSAPNAASAVTSAAAGAPARTRADLRRAAPSSAPVLSARHRQALGRASTSSRCSKARSAT